MSPKKRVFVISAGSLSILIACFFFVVPSQIARHMNRVVDEHPSQPPGNDVASHQNLFIADAHADTLLWGRDPSQRASYGHIDLPRLIEGNIGLQVFSAVTKTPRGLNFERNDGSSDNITALVIAQRWPFRTWNSHYERARYQAWRLHEMAAESDGKFVIIKNRDELMALVEQRRSERRPSGGLLAIEGLHALEGRIENVERLYNTGYRMMGLTHFFDNAIGGSAHGIRKGGLTEFGLKVLKEMQRLGIAVDLAHASETLFFEAIEASDIPVVVSHTGVRGTCDRTRNLSDDQLHAIASNDGVVGIAFFAEAICGTTTAAIIDAIDYTVKKIGIRHVALGSDFDGAVTTPFDVTGLPRIVRALRDKGYPTKRIRAIMGGNLVRVLEQTLPRPSLPITR